MSETVNSNINLNDVINTGNTGKIAQGAGGYLEPGLIRALVLVPVSDSAIPATAMVSQEAFATYVDAKFVADNRQDRWFMFANLDSFKDDTKKSSNEDTGIFQTDVFKYAPKYSFRYMTGFANFQEVLSFQNCQGTYNFYWIDSNGAWNGWGFPDGDGSLNAYILYQLFINDIGRTTDKTLNAYTFMVQALNRAQYNEQFAYYAAGTEPEAIAMLQNAFLVDASATLGMPLTIDTTTDVVLTIKMNQGATDFVQKYLSDITAAYFTAFNLTTSAALTVSTVQTGLIAVSGQTYYYAWLTLSAAPTATNLVRFALAAPSVINGVTPNTNVVNEIPFTVTHTF